MNFKVSPLFTEVWDSINGDYSNIVNEGTTRSTKTWTYFQVIFLYSAENPNTTINVLRDTAVSCRKIVEKEFREWLNDPQGRMASVKLGLLSISEAVKLMKEESLMPYVKENKSLHTWTFPNNSMISFDGADDIQKVMGMASTIAWLNEPYEMSEEIYNQISQRTTKCVMIDWNPKQSHWIEDVKKKSDTKFIFSTWKNNPFLGVRQIKDILRHQMVKQSNVVKSNLITESDAFKYDLELNKLKFNKSQLAELKRTIYNQSTSNYIEDSAWHWTVFGEGLKAELPNRIFKWKEIQLHEYYNIDSYVYYGVDWGLVDPFSIVEVKYHDGNLYVHELNYTNENKLVEQNMSNLNIINQNGGIIPKVFSDCNVRKDRPIVCDSNYTEKIKTLRDYGWEYALAAKKPPGSIVAGISVLKQLNVFYTNTSSNIKYEQENYSWEKGRDGTNINYPKDVDNHCCDSIRYITNFLVEQKIIKIV